MIALARRLLGGQPAPRRAPAAISFFEGGRSRTARDRRRRRINNKLTPATRSTSRGLTGGVNSDAPEG